MIQGQKYAISNFYTIDKGLPSNHCYEIAEDNDGFLWIGTTNGISRFDGKRFVNYTTKNGLPSNDVLQVRKDNDGTIWANCYKQPPSYFDEKNNRFVCFDTNPSISSKFKSMSFIQFDTSDGITYYNSDGTFVFKNKKIVSISYHNLIPIKVDSKKYYAYSNMRLSQLEKIKISFYDQNSKLINELFPKNSAQIFTTQLYKNNFICIRNKQIEIIELKKLKPLVTHVKKIELDSNYKTFTIINNEYKVITNSGSIYIIDAKTLKLKNKIETNHNVNNAFKDRNGTLWVSTVTNGLLKYTTPKIIKKEFPSNQNTSLLSIYINNQNQIFAGNYQGEIFANNKLIPLAGYGNQKNTTWIRYIASFDNKLVSVSENGICTNFKKNELVINHLQLTIKSSLKLNDSLLIIGAMSGLFKRNMLTKKVEPLFLKQERVLKLVKINNHEFYFTANLGIYKYSLLTHDYQLIFPVNLLKKDDVGGISLGKNNSLWIYTSKGNLHLLKQNKIVFSIVNSDELPINITKIIEIDQQLWVASNEGMYIINLENLSKYSIKKITQSDGLTSNFINDFDYKNDSIYCATNNGISIIPKNFEFKNISNIPFLVSLKINNKNVPIQEKYDLNKDQKNVILDLASIDLTGHFKKFQYSINTSKDWYNVEGNILNLILKGGQNTILIRAINENNSIGEKILELQFRVVIPFYELPLFWGFVFFLFSCLIFYFFTQKKLAKQQQNFQQQLELEKQRNKITADLHDEIGSTLSSLQINSAVANKLLDNDTNNAKKVLQKVENQAKNLADKIGDIIWSMKPGKDEFMTLSTRIKNFCNDVLSATNINYTIDINPKIDNLITDFDTRKNILLITKEAINNALKYSKATQLSVVMKLENELITLIISDDGIGFNPDLIIGNGIGNMKKRALDLNAIFEITSSPKCGTSIKLALKSIP